MKSRRNAFLGVLLALGLVAAACQPGGPQAPEKQTGGVLRVEWSEPGSFDPPNMETSEDIGIGRVVFEGLVTYEDKTAEVLPGVATEWEANADSTVWTFTLRDDAVFSNDEPITAETFVRSWTRTTSQETASEVGYHLAGIQGYTEHFEGGAPDLPGVEAVNDTTLRVTLSEPDPEFAIKTGHSSFFPVPSEAAIQAQQPSFAEFPIGNGPFMFKEAWRHNQSVTLVRNPTYVGDLEPSLDEIVLVILPDFDTAYLEWQAGNLDWTRVSGAKIDEARASGKLLETPTATIDYLNTYTTKPPTDNKLFRQAVSLAINRQAIADAVYAGNRVVADSILPTVMPGYRKGACEYCAFDPARAKQLLAQAGVAPGTTVQIGLNAGAGHEPWIQAVADQLETNLGINVGDPIGVQPFSEYLRVLEGPEGMHLARLGWGMDYPTPANFLFPLFHSASADNHSKYRNPQFESLLANAAREDSVEERIEIYQQAEDIVLEDMSIIPMWWRRGGYLANSDKFADLFVTALDDPSFVAAYLKEGASP